MFLARLRVGSAAALDRVSRAKTCPPSGGAGDGSALALLRLLEAPRRFERWRTKESRAAASAPTHVLLICRCGVGNSRASPKAQVDRKTGGSGRVGSGLGPDDARFHSASFHFFAAVTGADLIAHAQQASDAGSQLHEIMAEDLPALTAFKFNPFPLSAPPRAARTIITRA
jgi:hypothetical protein